MEAKSTLEAIREERRRNEEGAKDKADAPFLEMVVEDIRKVKEEAEKDDAKSFLKFINDHYIPEARKIALTDEMLLPGQIERTMVTKFTLIFAPDKNVNEPRQIQILREEIMIKINGFREGMCS